jgi:hypothetical protein
MSVKYLFRLGEVFPMGATNVAIGSVVTPGIVDAVLKAALNPTGVGRIQHP